MGRRELSKNSKKSKSDKKTNRAMPAKYEPKNLLKNLTFVQSDIVTESKTGEMDYKQFPKDTEKRKFREDKSAVTAVGDQLCVNHSSKAGVISLDDPPVWLDGDYDFDSVLNAQTSHNVPRRRSEKLTLHEEQVESGKVVERDRREELVAKTIDVQGDGPVNQKREESSSEEAKDPQSSKFKPYIWHNGVRIANIRHNCDWPKGIKLQKLNRKEKNYLSSFVSWASDWAIYNNDRPNTTLNTRSLIEAVDRVIGRIASFRTYSEFLAVCDLIELATEAIKDCVIDIRSQPITTKEMEQLGEWASWASSMALCIDRSFQRCPRSEHIRSSINVALDDIMFCETWVQYDKINAKKYWLTRVINEYICTAQPTQQ